MADEEAKRATEEEGMGRPISWNGIKTTVKTVIKDGVIEHPMIKLAYSCKSKSKEKLISNRKDQVLLARLRSGHHNGFKSYQHRLNEEEDPSCPRCTERSLTEEVMQTVNLDTVEHWLGCDATAAARMKDFGRYKVGLDILTSDPRNSVAHARRTLRSAQWC